MAFTVEDGTGLPGANSYVTVAFADEYHEDRGQLAWVALSILERQRNLVRATDYIDKRFGKRFRGFRQNKSQALEWPRLDAFDNDEFLLNDVDDIPRQLQKACAEYALRASTNAQLAPDNTSTGVRATTREVGPIKIVDELTSTNNQSSLLSPTSINDYPEADLWIEELIRSGKSRDLGRA